MMVRSVKTSQKRGALVLFSIGAVPLCLSAAASAVSFGAAMQETSTERLNERSRELGAAVASWVEDRESFTRVLAHHPGLLDLPPERKLELLRSATQHYRGAATISLIGPDGEQLVRSDGQPLQRLGDRAYFKKARAGEAGFEMVLRRADREPSLILATPLEGGAEGEHHVLILSTGAAELTRLVSAFEREPGSAFILDAANRIVAHSDRSRLFADMTESHLARALSAQASADVTYIDEGGQRWAAAHATILHGLRAVVQEPQRAARRRLSGALAISACVLAGLLFALGWVTWYLSRASRRLSSGP
jgi:hypothetical protein